MQTHAVHEDQTGMWPMLLGCRWRFNPGIFPMVTTRCQLKAKPWTSSMEPPNSDWFVTVTVSLKPDRAFIYFLEPLHATSYTYFIIRCSFIMASLHRTSLFMNHDYDYDDPQHLKGRRNPYSQQLIQSFVCRWNAFLDSAWKWMFA